MFLLKCHWSFTLTGYNSCHSLSPNDPFPSRPLNSHMGSRFWPTVSHLNCLPYDDLSFWSSPHPIAVSPPFPPMELYRPLSTLTMRKPLSFSNQYQGSVSSCSSRPTPLTPKRQGPFKQIFITPQLLSFRGSLNGFTCLTSNPLISHLRVISLHTWWLKQGPVLLSSRGHRDQWLCLQFQRNGVSLYNRTQLY